MPPTTQRVCLTAIEATKRLCITLPTLEGLKFALVTFYREVLVRYPYASAAILLLWSFYPKSPFKAMYYFFYIIPHAMILGLLNCIGFGEEGVRHDSHASRASIFSTSRSYGATDHELRADDNPGVRFVGFLWRILGLLCMYAALVVLLKYGGQYWGGRMYTSVS
ncbi:hypothetical protein BYT27DRAFT_7233613 [Phlegmacium glaucopus]|nr:hypothetical protein BYT27DRAFT_7233613 [Phlegmacium glaucopus]